MKHLGMAQFAEDRLKHSITPLDSKQTRSGKVLPYPRTTWSNLERSSLHQLRWLRPKTWSTSSITVFSPFPRPKCRLHMHCVVWPVGTGSETTTLLLLLSSPPNEQSEWRRYCFRSMCVCLCVRSRPVNQTSLQRLKLRTSNLTCMFTGTVRTWPLKITIL